TSPTSGAKPSPRHPRGNSHPARSPTPSRAPGTAPEPGTANRSPRPTRWSSRCSWSARRPTTPATCCACHSSTTHCGDLAVKKLAVIAAMLVLFSPALLLLGVGMMFSPGANASCTTSTSGPSVVGPVPDSLDVTTADGQTFTLNTTQLAHAATIIQTGSQIEGVNRDGLQIALMAALTESNLRMLANTSVYPDSGTYPNDGDASDHDSLGLFQMRPQAGWGTVADL